MITGGIDISVGSFVAMGCMMLAWMMEKGGIGAVPAVLIVLVTGIVFGLVQGFLVAYMDIQPFIVTLAGMFFARGMTAIISKDMISITNETFMAWAKLKLYFPFGGYLNKKGVMIYPYIYPTVVIALILLVLAFIMLKFTKFGRSIYAIGGNEQSALMMGLNVRRVKLKAYVLDGFLCGIGSILFCLNTLGGFVEQAKGFEMDAIASSVIGGTLRRCRKCLRNAVWCSDQSNDRGIYYIPGNSVILVDQNHDRSIALLLYRTPVCTGYDEKEKITPKTCTWISGI